VTSRRLIFALALGAGCGTSRPSTPLSNVRESPPNARESAPQKSLGCDQLHIDPEEALTVDAPLFCRRYRDEFLPEVADKTINCLDADKWHFCSVFPCSTEALESVPARPDPRCVRVAKACPGMDGISGEWCTRLITGMTARGRERFTTCLIETCGEQRGIGDCLWDPISVGCYDGPMR
jgi:hypothetical protein